MFYQLCEGSELGFAAAANVFFQMSPAELQWIIERAWAYREDRPDAWSPVPGHFLISPPPADSDESVLTLTDAYATLVPNPGTNFEINHLIYAYMIENTRVFEIVDRLLTEFLQGEKLGFASPEAQVWLRATEEVFFSDVPHGLAHRVASMIRPDIRATRRNAYYRMFGLDLNHGRGSATAYPYYKPQNANAEFIPLFESLLTEVWRAIVYANSLIGPSEIDDAKMADLVRRLQDMLWTRRQEGTLRREEFNSVVAMSWFHMTFFVDAPIFQSMGVNMASPTERLKMVGQRVGYPAHPQADSFLQLAQPMSEILAGIEVGDFNGNNGVAQFYTPNTAARGNMETIITHWSIATGRNLKARDVNQMPVAVR